MQMPWTFVTFSLPRSETLTTSMQQMQQLISHLHSVTLYEHPPVATCEEGVRSLLAPQGLVGVTVAAAEAEEDEVDVDPLARPRGPLISTEQPLSPAPNPALPSLSSSDLQLPDLTIARWVPQATAPQPSHLRGALCPLQPAPPLTSQLPWTRDNGTSLSPRRL